MELSIVAYSTQQLATGNTSEPLLGNDDIGHPSLARIYNSVKGAERIILDIYGPYETRRIAIVHLVVFDIEFASKYNPYDWTESYLCICDDFARKFEIDKNKHIFAEFSALVKEFCQGKARTLAGLQSSRNGFGKVCVILDLEVEQSKTKAGIGTYLLKSLPVILDDTLRVRPTWFVGCAHNRDMQDFFFEDDESDFASDAYYFLPDTIRYKQKEQRETIQAVRANLYKQCGYQRVSRLRGGIYFREYLFGRSNVEDEFAIIINKNDKSQLRVVTTSTNPFGLKRGEVAYEYRATYGLYSQESDTTLPERIGIMRLKMYDFDAPFRAGDNTSKFIGAGMNCEGDALYALHCAREKEEDGYSKDNPRGQACYIEAFYIAKPYRRQGYSKALHSALDAICEQSFGIRPQWYCTGVNPEDWSNSYMDNGGEPIALQAKDNPSEMKKTQIKMLEQFGFEQKKVDFSPLDFPYLVKRGASNL